MIPTTRTQRLENAAHEVSQVLKTFNARRTRCSSCLIDHDEDRGQAEIARSLTAILEKLDKVTRKVTREDRVG